MSTRLDFYNDFIKQDLKYAYSELSESVSAICINEILKSTREISKLAGRVGAGGEAQQAVQLCDQSKYVSK